MYFYPYKALIQTAINIIDAKDTYDKIDVFNDLTKINQEISRLSYSDDIQNATKLDEEMYKKYVGIKLLDEAVSALKAAADILPSIGVPTQNNKMPKEKIIVNLRQDILGIYVDVLLKQGIISDAKQFVEKVV